jgi:hypothetical protein
MAGIHRGEIKECRDVFVFVHFGRGYPAVSDAAENTVFGLHRKNLRGHP